MSTDSIIVYAGEGSSHSWTWLADLFENRGVRNAEFLDAPSFLDSLGADKSTMVVSGGDAFAIAGAIAPSGFYRIRDHIQRGGLYVGMCAGAYLPLPSSIEPLNSFNISSTKIENIDCAGHQSPSPRVSIGYGTCSIVHPIRGEVKLESSAGSVTAPIYGGPIFKEPSDESVILRYAGFTDKTEFQVERGAAERIVVGRPAAISLDYGHGRLLLLGPHLEHPSFPEANKLFLGLANLEGNAYNGDVTFSEPENRHLSRSVADLKVAILGLENRSFLSGNKLWDGSRYMDLLHAVEKRSDIGDLRIATKVSNLLDRMRSRLLELSDGVPEDEDAGPKELIEAARLCVNYRFARLREERKQMGL